MYAQTSKIIRLTEFLILNSVQRKKIYDIFPGSPYRRKKIGVYTTNQFSPIPHSAISHHSPTLWTTYHIVQHQEILVLELDTRVYHQLIKLSFVCSENVPTFSWPGINERKTPLRNVFSEKEFFYVLVYGGSY